jgi:hypothetical protein
MKILEKISDKIVEKVIEFSVSLIFGLICSIIKKLISYLKKQFTGDARNRLRFKIEKTKKANKERINNRQKVS